MVNGLDTIDWASLQHAYGSAADVPDMIRQLASSDREERDEAIHGAYGNIFHQGTRYTATPKAIPFLVEIAARCDAEILDLITHCVAGYFSTAHGPRSGSGAIWGTPVRAMEDYGETVEILRACEEAAAPALPVCIRLLTERDAGVRCAALKLIAALHTYAERYEMVPRLQDLVASETEADVRAMVAFALTHVLPVGQESSLVSLARNDSDDLVRVVATMGCIRRSVAIPEMTPDLFRWLEDDDLGARYEELPCKAQDLAGDLGSLLSSLDRAVLLPALPTLVEKLRVADDFGVCGVLSVALRAVFGDGKAPAEGAALTGEQRRVLEALARNQAFWSIGNAMEILREYDLPSIPDKLAALVGIEYERDPVENARIGARAFAAFGPKRAIKKWQKVVEQYPDDPESLVQLGILHAQFGNDDGSELLERGLAYASSLKPALAGRAYFALGIVRAQAGDGEAALAAYTSAQPLLRGGERDQARSNRVAILQRLDRSAEALALVEEKPARTTDDFYHLGLAQVKAAKYAESIASISRVIADQPDHALAHYTIGCAHALSGDKEQALASVGRAIECDADLAPDIAGDSDFASIADDPRFQGLVGEHD